MTTLQRIIATVMAFINLFAANVMNIGKSEESKDFRVTSYVVATNVQDESKIHREDFDIITDVILFGCVTFGANGQLNIESTILEIGRASCRERV